jgi:hypothetical protein
MWNARVPWGRGVGKESCGTNAGAAPPRTYPRSLQLVSPVLRRSRPAEALDAHIHLPSHADPIFQ